MASSRFTRTRARLGVRTRQLPAGHPELDTIREELKSALVVQRIALVLDKAAVPLTAELRTEIDEVLDVRQVTDEAVLA